MKHEDSESTEKFHNSDKLACTFQKRFFSVKGKEDYEFFWDIYLEATQSEEAPFESFSHVEQSLESGFKPGMKVEVPNLDVPGYYWLASVVLTSGPLLLLRYVGNENNNTGDFWLNFKQEEIHELGWCAKNQKQLQPPHGIREKEINWNDLLDKELKKPATVPGYLLELKALTPVELVHPNMKLLVLEEQNPKNVWIATVIHNVGGHLLLRYDGCDDDSYDFWLFYLSPRIKAIESTPSCAFMYQAPSVIDHLRNREEWEQVLKSSWEEAQKYSRVLSRILHPLKPLEKHGFQVDMKLEMIEPLQRAHLCPGTVTTVVNDYWFLVKADSLEEDSDPAITCCHSFSQNIFPVGWAASHNLQLLSPKGYKSEGDAGFKWDEYLRYSNAEAVPEKCFHLEVDSRGFSPHQKLEAVNYKNTHQVCVATITRVEAPLLWIKLESNPEETFIEPLNSMDIFPAGFCASNDYPLQPPSFLLHMKQSKSHKSVPGIMNKLEMSKVKESSKKEEGGSKFWCPKIYFNHKCFSGPHLSKSRLAELPRHVGPGQVSLVLKEVLTLVISIAYKSTKVLRELQMKGSPTPGMHRQIMKAKYKGRSHCATMEFVQSRTEVEEFCRKICEKLECCPFLFGPTYVGDNCPENCYNLTKTKFTYNFVKKQKKHSLLLGNGNKGRKAKTFKRNKDDSSQEEEDDGKSTPSSHTGSEKQELERPSEKENQSSASSRIDEESQSSSDSMPSGRKTPKEVPKLTMVTRGARLPDFRNINLDLRWQQPLRYRLMKNQREEIPKEEPDDSLISPPMTPQGVSQSNSNAASEVDFQDELEVPESVSSERSDSPSLPSTPELMSIDSNPLEWSVADVVNLVKQTDCAPLARILQEQEIDGQALLLLSLQNVQEFLHLKLGPAIKFCHFIEKVKLVFYSKFSK